MLFVADEMGITNAEDRELILSEIYALKNPEDIDIELSLLGKVEFYDLYTIFHQIYCIL